MTIYRIPERRLKGPRASIVYQGKERATAQAEGRRPLLTVSTAMA